MNTPAVNISLIEQLPISRKKAEILQAIKNHRVVIISGETGSGKTTQIPKFCLEAGLGENGIIGCTQPRRIAAITVATRIAHELGEPLGNTVGYKIRFDDKTDKSAKIKLMTDGILLAEAQKDRSLPQYSTIIVDEAHERSLNIDFTLGLLKNLVRKRKDLRLIITSATIDTEKFSNAFDHAPIIEVSGRMFPVDIQYLPVGGYDSDQEMIDDQAYVEAAAEAVKHICSTSRSGDILVFMPTEQDITDTLDLIRGRNLPSTVTLPLYARLSAKEQAKVFSKTVGRKIIVSTNVAETSLTIPGIKYVVDSGLARIPHYSPRTRTTALPVTSISQSSANQRAGRCGRVENGICIRLYEEKDFIGRPFFTSPEIMRSNLADVILRMIALKLGDIQKFPFIDRPSPKSIKDGFDTLLELSAIQPKMIKRRSGSQKIYVLTGKGRLMARIPVDPKLSRILLEARDQGCVKEIGIIASALSIADPRQRPQDKSQQADQKHALFKDPASDFVTLLNIWNAWQSAQTELKSRSRVRKWCTDHFVSFKRLREWQDIHRQISNILKENRLNESAKNAAPFLQGTGTKDLKSKAFEIGGPVYTAIHKSLLSGYLANIAHKSEKNSYAAAKGQKAMIFPGSGLFNAGGNWIIAAEYVKTSQLFARTVANIDPAWLEPMGRALCVSTYFEPHWEKKRGEVMVKEQVTLFGLVIVNQRKRAYGALNPDEAGELFIRHALVEGEVSRPFPFMIHNRKLIEQVESIEHKTRERDILASDEEIFEFYRSRLSQPFYNIRTFSKFLKDQGDDTFLHMTVEDLKKKEVSADTLALYPDTLSQDQASFKLSYHFNPGHEKDGVTLRVPMSHVESLSLKQTDRLVPGLFKEKITALIKNLPKSYRKLLVPASQKADIITQEMPKTGDSLFNQLSRFVKERFNADIPPTAWSQARIDDHLKMRISVVDDKGKEIEASRDQRIIQKFAGPGQSNGSQALERIKTEFEIDDFTVENFKDLPDSVPVRESSGDTYHLYPGLKKEGQKLALRLFRSKQKAGESHLHGVVQLYRQAFPDDIKALEKDVRSATGLNRFADHFNGTQAFKASILERLLYDLFARDIRTLKAFEDHAAQTLPHLYRRGQSMIKSVTRLCELFESARLSLQSLARKTARSSQVHNLMLTLDSDLSSLVPPDFCDHYTLERIENLGRYVEALKIRAQRACENYIKEEKKAGELAPYTRYFKRLMGSLTPQSTEEKAREIEALYWLIEEFKISLFAQEIKTAVKVSPKKLDTVITRISNMI